MNISVLGALHSLYCLWTYCWVFVTPFWCWFNLFTSCDVLEWGVFFEHPLKVLFLGTPQLFYASSRSGGWSISGWISALVTDSSTWGVGAAGACRLALGGVSFSMSFLEGDWARLLLEDWTPCWLNWTSLFLLKIGDCGRLKLLMMPVNLLGSNSEFKVWLLGGSSLVNWRITTKNFSSVKKWLS